jgi:quercetin dioxygenase-like cupin family protein
MKVRIAIVGVLVAVIVATPALSTPGSGVVAPVLGRGVLEGKAKLKIRSTASDVVVQQLTIAPGGHTGWHSHYGPVVVLVTAGELTLYMADDRKCRPHTYSAGESFIDYGRGNVHIAFNEGTTPVGLYATYLDVPVGGAFRIDHPDPGNCSF